MAPLVRTGGSRHTGLAALPHRNIHKKGIDDETYKLRYVRYKIQDDGPNIVGSRQKIKWVFYSFKSIKKYGLVITLKRISGKINRKFGR